MSYQSSAGSSIALTSSIPASFDAAGYAALTYIEIGEVTNIGELGREYNPIEHMPISDRLVKQAKGSYRGGSIDLQYAFDRNDAGQILLRTASRSDADYSFRITLQDGFKFYFYGKVMSAKTNIGGVDSITSGSSTISITSRDIIEV